MLDKAPASEADPTLAVAERQLALLGELAQIAMAAARAFGSSAVASAEAEKAILADEHFVPEVGRARACGARDAAESLQKVFRAMRLTMKLEMAVAEILRDIRAGIVTHSHAGGDAGAPAENPRSHGRSAGVLADPRSEDDDRDRDRPEADTERLVEFDRPDTLFGAPFKDTVDDIRADLGATVDWDRLNVGKPTLKSEQISPKPPSWSECRPPRPSPEPGPPDAADRVTHPPPSRIAETPS